MLQERQLLRPDLNVLHLRCDGGTLLARLREDWGVSGLFGLDYFDSNIRYATEVLQLEHIARLDAGRCLMPFAPRFDLIISNHMLTHALDPRRFLATLREQLKPEGVVFFYNEVDHEALMAPDSGFLAGGINAFHKQLLTRVSLAHLLRAAGFRFDAVRGQGSWLEVLTSPGASSSPAPPPDADEIRRLHAMFAAWAREHERRRTTRRARRAMAAWMGKKRYERLAAAYRALRRLPRLVTTRPRGQPPTS
jgi:SAM-dependent methyltransferase